MRRRLALTVVLGVLTTLAVAAVAYAVTITVQGGNLRMTFGGSVSPKALPKSKLAPISLNISGKIETTDGTHPSAIREVVADVDKNGAINAKGVPVCTKGQLTARTSNQAKAVCSKALIGEGKADAEIAFAEMKPLLVPSPLYVFNGGTKGGKTTLLIHTYITQPVPAAIISTVEITKIHKGRYGFHTVTKIPRISGGSGSAIDFNFTIGKKKFTYKGKKHTYLEAKCPDGHFSSNLVKALFRNEAETPGVAPETELSGTLLVPCTPKG